MHESKGELFQAAKRFVSAATTDEPWQGFDFYKEMLIKSASLLEAAEDTVSTRSLEAWVRGLSSLSIPWGCDAQRHNNQRIVYCLEKGIELKSARMMDRVGGAAFMPAIELFGLMASGEVSSTAFSFVLK